VKEDVPQTEQTSEDITADTEPPVADSARSDVATERALSSGDLSDELSPLTACL
jgi:hypothetical protein